MEMVALLVVFGVLVCMSVESTVEKRGVGKRECGQEEHHNTARDICESCYELCSSPKPARRRICRWDKKCRAVYMKMQATTPSPTATNGPTLPPHTTTSPPKNVPKSLPQKDKKDKKKKLDGSVDGLLISLGVVIGVVLLGAVAYFEKQRNPDCFKCGQQNPPPGPPVDEDELVRLPVQREAVTIASHGNVSQADSGYVHSNDTVREAARIEAARRVAAGQGPAGQGVAGQGPVGQGAVGQGAAGQDVGQGAAAQGPASYSIVDETPGSMQTLQKVLDYRTDNGQQVEQAID